MSDKKKDKEKSDKVDSLDPETIKGPQQREHHNQYGDQDETPRVQ